MKVQLSWTEKLEAVRKTKINFNWKRRKARRLNGKPKRNHSSKLQNTIWNVYCTRQITSKPRLCQRNAFNDSRAASNNTLHSKTQRESLDAKEHRIIAHSHLLETISMKPRGWIDDMIQPGGYTYEYTLSCMNTTLQHEKEQKARRLNELGVK